MAFSSFSEMIGYIRLLEGRKPAPVGTKRTWGKSRHHVVKTKDGWVTDHSKKKAKR